MILLRGKKIKLLYEDALRQYFCLIISLSTSALPFCTPKRLSKHLNAKLMTKSEAKC